jgi:flavin reductase (DIM6/NTAB) family NADH-FMN oxidoreductase RutF
MPCAEVGTEAFERLVASLDYPMVVVAAAAADGERSGCLAGFTTQSSIDPPRWVVCISKVNHTHEVASKASVLVVHLLRSAQSDLATLFGSETGDELDKFEHCEWSPGPAATPVLRDTDWFAGRIIERWDAGDHAALLLDVLADGSAARADEPQLGFQAVRDLDPGHDADA